MQRDEILQQAEQLVNGKRAEDYGDAYENHCRIAQRTPNAWGDQGCPCDINDGLVKNFAYPKHHKP